MPAIPLIGLGISAYSAYKQAKQAGEAAKAQKELMGKQTALSGELSGFARGQTSLAGPALAKAMQHYTTLATGSRGAIGAELAPGIAGVTEASRGAERGINRSIPAGPGRDRAVADLYRQRAGQIGMMPFAAQQQGYAGMEKMGNQGMSNALNAYRESASALTGASSTGVNAQNANNDKWDVINNGIAKGVQFGTGAYDWWKKSRGGGGVPGLPGGSSGPF